MVQHFFLPSNGDWSGPPILVLRLSLSPGEHILDGRKRLAEWNKRGLKGTVPTLRIYSHTDAVKHLVLAGHHDRAAAHLVRYAPEYINNTAGMWKALTGLHYNKFQPLLRELKTPEERHKLKRRAISVVHAIRALILRADEGEQITKRHLVEALGKFIDG